MLNAWRIKHGATVDSRRSVTGEIIAPGWILPTGIGVAVIDRAIASAAATATSATRVFRAVAAIAVSIPTNEIIGTIAAEKWRIRQPGEDQGVPSSKIARPWHRAPRW